MKKLALALVCFASVAFIASCTPEITNPEPSIAVKTGENYVYDGQTVDIGQNYTLGFRAASNSQTMKELATFKLNVKFTTLDDTETRSYDSIINVSGTEYTFEQVLNFGLTNNEESRELVAKAVFTATITDVDGKMNSTTINLNINQPAVPLETKNFTWFRQGSNPGEGLAEYGLEWKSNGSREDFAIITPVEGATLYFLTMETEEEWNSITTDLEKAAYFSDGSGNYSVLTDFSGVSAWNSKDYNFFIGSLYNGEYHMIHITRGDVERITNSQGQFLRTDITITGQSK